MKRTKGLADVADRSPGAFRADGSFDEDGWEAQRGPIDGLIRALVRGRRAGQLSPEGAANAVLAANGVGAFPNVEQWRGRSAWSECRASTSAEEAVRRAGLGCEGHHCGGRWVQGYEKDCRELGHRRAGDQETGAMQKALLATLSGWES